MNARTRIGVAVLVSAALLTARPAGADWSPFSVYWENIARAAEQNDAAQVRKLLTDGKSPNETDQSGHTGLHVVAMNGNLQIAAILLKAGARATITDGLGNTPLHYAADRNQVEMVKLFLDVGTPIDTPNKQGMTPLMMAARDGNLDVIQVLLARGANVGKSDYTGRDAISWAAESHRQAVVDTIKRAVAKHS
jgi:uncharacterized protein